jgi:outer membrane receptor protein involved in Fe transport
MKIFLSAETYYEKVKEKLVAVPTYSQFRWSMMNIGETEIYGLEAKGRLRHESAVSWELSAQYTFQRAKDLSLKGDVSYGGQVAYIPWSSGSVSADISWKGWKAEWNLIWNGRRYSSSANLPEYRLEGWNSHDLWLTKGFSLNGTAYDISLGIRNLSGEKYSVVPGFPMPGRQFAVNVGMKF